MLTTWLMNRAKDRSPGTSGGRIEKSPPTSTKNEPIELCETTHKLLGFVICHKGIEVDLQNQGDCRAPTKKNLQELRGFQGCLTYIHKFISKL